MRAEISSRTQHIRRRTGDTGYGYGYGYMEERIRAEYMTGYGARRTVGVTPNRLCSTSAFSNTVVPTTLPESEDISGTRQGITGMSGI